MGIWVVSSRDVSPTLGVKKQRKKERKKENPIFILKEAEWVQVLILGYEDERKNNKSPTAFQRTLSVQLVGRILSPEQIGS